MPIRWITSGVMTRVDVAVAVVRCFLLQAFTELVENSSHLSTVERKIIKLLTVVFI